MRSVLLVCAVLIVHVAVLVATAVGSPCPERCPDEGPDGRCPAACATCPCSPRGATPDTSSAAGAPPKRREPVPASATLAPREPAPADIFHVPERALA